MMVSQILSLTRLIPKIKYIPHQKDFFGKIIPIAKVINEGDIVAILLMFLPNNLGKVLTIKTENK
jgi:hypothetical protein